MELFFCFLKRNLILVITGLLLLSAANADEKIVSLDSYQALTSDLKSYKVGEPISILILETTSAESSAGTGLQRDVSVDAKAHDSVNDVAAGFGIGSESNGSGKTARNGLVRTQISARIVEVLPDNIYRISGEHKTRINDETQIVSVTGLIKATDISKDNAVLSYKIAEANIQVSGEGDVSGANKKNIFYRFLHWLRLL